MNGKLWTLSELTVVNDRSLTHSKVALKLGRSVNSVFTKRKELGIIEECKGHRRNGKVVFTPEEDQMILDWKGYLTVLAKEMGKPYSSVRSRRELLNGRF